MSSEKPANKKPTCFVIAPIGEDGSETRKRSDKVFAHVFEVALGNEFKVVRADQISQPGMITTQILSALQDSELVLADLTEHNPNVFYELAVRHAVEKPVIHVTDPRWKIPFDVAGFRTIVFDFTDLDSVANAVKKLKEQASEIRSGSFGETPIKLANIMRRSSGESDQVVLLKEAVQQVVRLKEAVEGTSGLIMDQLDRIEDSIPGSKAQSLAALAKSLAALNPDARVVLNLTRPERVSNSKAERDSTDGPDKYEE